MNSYGVFIGRFQPVHNGHLKTIRQALTQVDNLVIVLGSCNACRTIKNPWSATVREQMILFSLTDEEKNRVYFVQAADYTYNDNAWIIQVQEKVGEITGDATDVLLFGHAKDDSSYYLQLFPQWKFVPCGYDPQIDASTLRDMYFRCDLMDISRYVCGNVLEHLRVCMMANATERTEEFVGLQTEYQFVQDYKAAWHGAPYPPTFVTVDAVVIKSGHVLVVRRGGFPGKGLIALPGGFIGQREKIQDACVRELKEETRIGVSKEELHAAITSSRVFDHPDRSLRGRTITHAFCVDLGIGPLPKVKGSDDADKAWWMPLREAAAREPDFYEDHFHIIQYFTSRF